MTCESATLWLVIREVSRVYIICIITLETLDEKRFSRRIGSMRLGTPWNCLSCIATMLAGLEI